MKQAQSLIKYENQVALANLTICAVRLQTRLGELDVPIAELVPEKGIKFARDLTEIERSISLVKLDHKRGQTAEDPAIRGSCGLRVAGNVGIKVHANEAGGVTNLVREVA